MKEVLYQEDSDILILMETKISDFCSRRVAGIWKHRRVEWEVLEVENMLGGILMMLNLRSCVAIEVVRGRHSLSIAFLDGDGVEF